jgi:hypothetical protein
VERRSPVMLERTKRKPRNLRKYSNVEVVDFDLNSDGR